MRDAQAKRDVHAATIRRTILSACRFYADDIQTRINQDAQPTKPQRDVAQLLICLRRLLIYGFTILPSAAIPAAEPPRQPEMSCLLARYISPDAARHN